jgi:hypothetical protein
VLRLERLAVVLADVAMAARPVSATAGRTARSGVLTTTIRRCGLGFATALAWNGISVWT